MVGACVMLQGTPNTKTTIATLGTSATLKVMMNSKAKPF
jgi:hypothetical protein